MTDWQYLAASTEAELDIARVKLGRLEMFYNEIKKLTLNHDVVISVDGNEYASVSPRKLGEALSKVNEEWYLDKN